MNIKGILKNLKNKGVKGTLAVHKKRKAELQYDDLMERMRVSVRGQFMDHPEIADEKPVVKKLAAAQIMRDIFGSSVMGSEEKRAEIDRIIAEMEAVMDADPAEEQQASWDDRMRSLENGKYRKFLKRLFVGHLMPELYDSLSGQPVQEKIVFMQPRSELNQSFKYIYNRIDKEYPYEPVLCELHYGEVSTAEHYMNALDFIREMVTARALMLHESSAYISHIDVRPETKVVQLWHGCGIIKHLGLSNADKPGFKKMATFLEFPEHSKYDLVTMAGEELRWVFEEFMGLPEGAPCLQAIGVSRTDEFFDETYVKNCYDTLHRLIPESLDKKVILYAPTYRGKGLGRYAPDDLDLNKMKDALSNDCILILKHHQTIKNLPEVPEDLKDKFVWDMTWSEDLDINQLMTVADICISDYSSVVFEFSLFERPILFYMFDLDEYSDSRGMYYTYEELAECGPICRTTDELIDCIKNIDERFDKSKVIKFKNRFMSACDGHATERIMAFIADNPKENKV